MEAGLKWKGEYMKFTKENLKQLSGFINSKGTEYTLGKMGRNLIRTTCKSWSGDENIEVVLGRLNREVWTPIYKKRRFYEIY